MATGSADGNGVPPSVPGGAGASAGSRRSTRTRRSANPTGLARITVPAAVRTRRLTVKSTWPVPTPSVTGASRRLAAMIASAIVRSIHARYSPSTTSAANGVTSGAECECE